MPYLIYVPHTKEYLAADTSGSFGDIFFGYLFYTERDRASRFMFRKVGDTEHKGTINNRTEVELTLCDDAGDPIGVVTRSHRYNTVLVLDKDVNVRYFGDIYNATLEYIS